MPENYGRKFMVLLDMCHYQVDHIIKDHNFLTTRGEGVCAVAATLADWIFLLRRREPSWRGTARQLEVKECLPRTWHLDIGWQPDAQTELSGSHRHDAQAHTAAVAQRHHLRRYSVLGAAPRNLQKFANI